MNCVLNLTEVAVVFESLGTEEGSKNASWCEEKVQLCLEMEESTAVHIASFEDVKKHVIQRSRLAEDSNLDLVETFNTKVSDLSKKNHDGGPRRFLNHGKYKSFKQKVWQVNHPDEPYPGDDSEFVVKTTQEPSMKCPVTREILVNPVTNKNCGHHYSKDAIQNLIRGNKRAQSCNCPVSGCSAKVSLKTLEDNKDLEVLVQRHLLKRQNEEEEEEDEDIIDV